MLKFNYLLILFSLLLLANSWQIVEIPCDVANCSKCDDQNITCVECKDGYFLDEDNKMCSECDIKIDHCVSCSFVNATE